MTQVDQIAKLAKWMGYEFKYLTDDSRCVWYIYKEKDGVAIDKHRNWDPFSNIADAWMLVERTKELWGDHVTETCEIRTKWDSVQLIHLYEMSASEAAAAITNAVLEVINV